MDFLTTIIGIIVVSLLFFLVISVIIREVIELLFKLPENTFYKSGEISIALTGILIIQFLVTKSKLLSLIVLCVFLLTLFFMLVKIYEISYKKTFLIFLTVCAAIVILFVIIAFLMSLTF
jgi:hypothetical protein